MNDNINGVGNISEYSPLTDGSYESHGQKRMKASEERRTNSIDIKDRTNGPGNGHKRN